MIRLYDTLTGEVRPLAQRDEGKVSLYACGPTVYDHPHLGHARQAMTYDFMRRYFEWRGFEVHHVANVTDIDDNIINRASREGSTEPEVAAEWKAVYDEAIFDAFPRAFVNVVETDGLFALTMQQHGLLRPLATGELSDGTLRYLLLVAALLTPRPPPLIVLNEPETSLHPSLIPPLARLIAGARAHSQVIVVSHDRQLVEMLERTGGRVLELIKHSGETKVPNVEPPAWVWPKR